MVSIGLDDLGRSHIVHQTLILVRGETRVVGHLHSFLLMDIRRLAALKLLERQGLLTRGQNLVWRSIATQSDDPLPLSSGHVLMACPPLLSLRPTVLLFWNG